MYQISVIVPVYKAEKYIEACVQSILAQTFQDFELILVEDGSPDRSGEICDFLSTTDSRIHVHHKKNGGAASARNVGLDIAQGNHIAFIDGDDCIHPQYLEFLLQLLKEADADIAMCHYDFFEVMGQWFNGVPDKDYTLLKGSEILSNFRDHCRKVSLISMCMKLYKRSVFDGLRIPEGYIEEDSMVLPMILERANRIARSESKLYHWRVTPGSVTRSAFSAKDFAYIEVSRFQAEFFAERGSKQTRYFQKDFLQRTLQYYYKVCDEKPDLMNEFQFHLKRYRKLFPRYIFAGGMCLRERIAYCLFWISPKAARKLYESVYGACKV